MTLSELMADLVMRLDIAVYPTAAMLLFITVYVAIVLRALGQRREQTFERARHLPLEPDGPLGRGDLAP